MATITISLSDTLKSFVENQVEAKGYNNSSEYFCSLLREAREKEQRIRLEALLLESLISGEGDIPSDVFWAELKAEAVELLAMRAREAIRIENSDPSHSDTESVTTIQEEDLLMPSRIPTVRLPAGWYDYILTDGVDEKKPGIYEWRIEGAGSYIGKYTRISRPKIEYEKNVLKILNGWPYRSKKPEKFRRVHRELERAHREGRRITLVILENVDPFLLNQRESELIADRGTLNGRNPR